MLCPQEMAEDPVNRSNWDGFYYRQHRIALHGLDLTARQVQQQWTNMLKDIRHRASGTKSVWF